MDADFSTTIRGHELEYLADTHTYLIDGVIYPSITQLLGVKFGNKYSGISAATLKRAADAGTAVHEAIEAYCKDGTPSELPELRNFQFLQKHYSFDVLSNEVPVILFTEDGEPFAAGRLDLVLELDGQIGGADIKRTAVLDKDYLAYQLNFYRVAYRQSYGVEWQFLAAVHLRADKTRKFVYIPICESLVNEVIKGTKGAKTA